MCASKLAVYIVRLCGAPMVELHHAGISVENRRSRAVTYISCAEKSIFSSVWFHILRRLPAPCFLLYQRA